MHYYSKTLIKNYENSKENNRKVAKKPKGLKKKFIILFENYWNSTKIFEKNKNEFSNNS